MNRSVPGAEMRNAAAAALLLLVAGCGLLDSDDKTTNSRLLWKYETGVQIYYGSPALSVDEATVYIGTSSPALLPAGTQHALYAVETGTGTLRWRYDLGTRQVRSPPAVGSDGAVHFVGSETASGVPAGDWLYRLSPGGNLQWIHQVNHAPTDLPIGLSPPAIGPDGTVYVAGDSLYAFSSDGSLRWRDRTYYNEDLRNAPSLYGGDVLYFVFHNIALHALDPASGDTLWLSQNLWWDHVFSAPSVGPDGSVFLGCQDGYFYAFESTGAQRWTFQPSSVLGYLIDLRSSAAIDADGSVYVGVNGLGGLSAMMALSATGTLRWFFRPDDLPPELPVTHSQIYSSPAIGADGTLFFGMEFGRVYALDSIDGSVKWWYGTGEGIVWSSPALDSGGTLYIGDLGGTLYALQTDCGGLKTIAPWPKYRHDNQNTGRGGLYGGR